MAVKKNPRTIVMEDAQVDAIMIAELKDTYEWQLKEPKATRDYQLIESLKDIMAYYMPEAEYNRYVTASEKRKK